jgi:predicted regulator of Ras-like GTPase activity (Roadblock/LC7/MglB family)
VFRLILHELLATTQGALAALFLDYEGETVELVCEHDLNDHDLRILGAYQGIFLTRLRELCANAGAGEPHRFKVEFENSAVLIVDIKDGYYIVLLVDRRFNEGYAWRQLDACRSKLIAEM